MDTETISSQTETKSNYLQGAGEEVVSYLQAAGLQEDLVAELQEHIAFGMENLNLEIKEELFKKKHALEKIVLWLCISKRWKDATLEEKKELSVHNKVLKKRPSFGNHVQKNNLVFRG